MINRRLQLGVGAGLTVVVQQPGPGSPINSAMAAPHVGGGHKRPLEERSASAPDTQDPMLIKGPSVNIVDGWTARDEGVSPRGVAATELFLTEESLRKITQLFNIMDDNSDGFLSQADFLVRGRPAY